MTDSEGDWEVEDDEGDAFDDEAVMEPYEIIDSEVSDAEIKERIAELFQGILEHHGLKDYTTLLLYDDNDPIGSWHSNRIYKAASRAAKNRNILLILHSNGGGIKPAYLMSKTCKRLAKSKFAVAVPRRAKSAATLIALGGDEIHMGLMSELGPIDPQIGPYPSLALTNAVETLADLSARFPGSSDMFAKYLTEKLDVAALGYSRRVCESATQYAVRLLEGKPVPETSSPQHLADHFVNHYKDHGFVIDAEEAGKLLGTMVRENTAEYRAANEIYEFLEKAKFCFEIFRASKFDYVGDLESGLVIRKQTS